MFGKPGLLAEPSPWSVSLVQRPLGWEIQPHQTKYDTGLGLPKATDLGRFERSLSTRSPRLCDMHFLWAVLGAALLRSVGKTAVATPYQLTR